MRLRPRVRLRRNVSTCSFVSTSGIYRVGIFLSTLFMSGTPILSNYCQLSHIAGPFLPSMSRPPLGKNLYDLRTDAKLTQEGLAEKAGVQQSDVSKWERGVATPDLESVLKIASALPCELDRLVQGMSTQYDTSRDLLGRGVPVQPSATHLSGAEGKGDVPASPSVQQSAARLAPLDPLEEIHALASRLDNLATALLEDRKARSAKTRRGRSARKAS